MVVIGGCSSKNISHINQTGLKNTEKPAFNQDQVYVSANTTGLQLLKGICADSKDKNAIFSPLSLSTILAVLQNGAEGKTRQEINTLINLDQLPTERLNEKYHMTIEKILKSDYEENGKKTTVIELANSLWVQEKLPVKDTFLKPAHNYYNTEAFNVNFTDKNTISTMNQWIEDKTHGRIFNHISGFDSPPAMVAFNSLYFNGKWQIPFDPSNTQPEKFYLNNGRTVKVDMMNADQWIGYYENDQVQMGKFDYFGCNMLVILPKGDTNDYLRHLDYEQIQTALSNAELRKVKVKFPKFSFNQKNELVSHLQAMGMESAFDSNKADFSGIADGSTNFNLFISKISQECFISVDEEGTEAAALTSVILSGSAPPRENAPVKFYVNKPFIFIISDDYNGLFLFIGKVENPLDK